MSSLISCPEKEISPLLDTIAEMCSNVADCSTIFSICDDSEAPALALNSKNLVEVDSDVDQ